MLSEGAGEEAFAGGAGEDGQVELAEAVEVGEEGVIFVEYFAEAEAGIEDNLVAWDAGGGGGFETFGQFREDENEDCVGREGREMRPFLWAASGVHEDGSTVEFGAGGGHVRIPEVAADVVDDLGPGFYRAAGGGGMEGVDGEDGARALLEDSFDDRENAGLFFRGREWRGIGASGFASDVEDIGAFFKHG